MDNIKHGFLNTDEFPLVIEAPHEKMSIAETYAFLNGHLPFIKQKLLKYGAILFRGFPVENAHHFSDFISNLQLGKFIDYVGGDSPRNKIHGGVYTSTEAPPSLKIPLHNELSFVKNYPKHIYFFCEVAPAAQGETIIADARKVYQAMDAHIKNRFQEKGLKYVSAYYHDSALMELVNKFQRSHKSWPEVFEAKTKEEVERKCRENDFHFQWNKNDWIKIHQIRPPFMVHPETNENVWFNQVHLYDFNPKFLGFWRYLAVKMFYFQPHMRLHEIFFADNSKIPKKDIYRILDVLDQNTVAFPWKKGDVMVLDNVLAMHGRAPFKGKRRILAAMTS